MKFNIIEEKIITSTNAVLKDLANNGAAHATVLTAEGQTNGKGRLGRGFYSPEKTGLYMSILLKEGIDEEPPLLTTLAAVCVMKAIKDLTGKNTQVKWVNDVLLNGKKICGILTQGSFKAKKLEYAIIGIGVNVSTDSFPEEIKNTAGSLGEAPQFCKELRDKILYHFSVEFKKMKNRDFLDFYRQNCVTIGREIKIISPGKEPIEALAKGVDDNAGLVVEYKDKTKGVVSSGEVSVR